MACPASTHGLHVCFCQRSFEMHAPMMVRSEHYIGAAYFTLLTSQYNPSSLEFFASKSANRRRRPLAILPKHSQQFSILQQYLGILPSLPVHSASSLFCGVHAIYRLTSGSFRSSDQWRTFEPYAKHSISARRRRPCH